jgi:hypothetical protein
MADFGISGVEPWGSATTVLVSKMDLRETGCEDERFYYQEFLSQLAGYLITYSDLLVTSLLL